MVEFNISEKARKVLEEQFNGKTLRVHRKTKT